MAGWTGIGRDRINWDGQISQNQAPTANNDLVTKAYVDNAVANLKLDYYLTNTGSSIGGYFQMIKTHTSSATMNATGITANTTTNIFNFATNANEPNLDRLVVGSYDIHSHIYKTGVKDISIYYQLYKRTSGGVETLCGTSPSFSITTTSTFYDTYISIDTEITLATTDRLVLKVYAVSTGAISNTVVSMKVGGNEDSHISIDVTSDILNNYQTQLNGTGFVKASGTTVTYDNSTYLTTYTETDPVYLANTYAVDMDQNVATDSDVVFNTIGSAGDITFTNAGNNLGWIKNPNAGGYAPAWLGLGTDNSTGVQGAVFYVDGDLVDFAWKCNGGSDTCRLETRGGYIFSSYSTTEMQFGNTDLYVGGYGYMPNFFMGGASTSFSTGLAVGVEMNPSTYPPSLNGLYVVGQSNLMEPVGANTTSPEAQIHSVANPNFTEYCYRPRSRKATIDYGGGSFIDTAGTYYLWAYKTAGDSTVFYSQNVDDNYSDMTSTNFQVNITWAGNIGDEGYILEFNDGSNSYYIDVGAVNSYLVDGDFSLWTAGNFSAPYSTPYSYVNADPIALKTEGGKVRMKDLPTSDPADGTNTLWYDTSTRIVYMGT